MRRLTGILFWSPRPTYGRPSGEADSEGLHNWVALSIYREFMSRLRHFSQALAMELTSIASQDARDFWHTRLGSPGKFCLSLSVSFTTQPSETQRGPLTILPSFRNEELFPLGLTIFDVYL